MGFNFSKETYIKGNESVVFLIELSKNYNLAIFMEMCPLKTEFFDCEQYVSSVDDMILGVLEVLESV